MNASWLSGNCSTGDSWSAWEHQSENAVVWGRFSGVPVCWFLWNFISKQTPLANEYMSQPSWWLSLAMWSCSYHWMRAEVIGTAASHGPLRLALCFPGYFLLLTDWRQVRMTVCLDPKRLGSHTLKMEKPNYYLNTLALGCYVREN